MTRLFVLVAALATLSAPGVRGASALEQSGASSHDRAALARADLIAAHHPGKALRWLRGQALVGGATLQSDGATIDVSFRDGAQVAIVPRTFAAKGTEPARITPLGRVRQASNGTHALVLEPFADQLGLGPDAGQPEMDLLQSAGFSVDVLRNQDVTIAALERMADYSVVYMETHSNILTDGPDAGDAIIVTRDTDNKRYASYMPGAGDGSIMQATVAGDPRATLYLALRANFFKLHTGTFPNSSIMYVNGCAVVGAPVLWSALQSRNVSTLIGWDHEVYSSISDTSAQVLLSNLLKGETVSAAISDTRDAGLAESTVPDPQTGVGVVAHLGWDGNGDNTLQNAVQQMPPATATATPTVVVPTPTATVVPRLTLKVQSSLHSGKPGNITIWVRTGGSPVRGAQVRLHRKAHILARDVRAMTGANGRVVLKKVQAQRSGSLTLTASKTGFQGVTRTVKVH